MIHTLLRNKQVILASASPRRKAIFDLIGLNALQYPANLPEEQIYNNPIKLVKYHARSKAEKVKKLFEQDHLIVAADTVVFQKNELLEKPIDRIQAAQFLNRLSGNRHYVYSGIALAYKNTILADYAKSLVEFYPLSEQEITEYLETNEPLDKAGAYGIQGFGSQFIKNISGCYYNVMGFPVSLFYRMLKILLHE
jgi:septum formation protein